MATSLPTETLRALVDGKHGSPFEVLGIQNENGLVIRTLQPFARTVEVMDPDAGNPLEMERIHPDGLFELMLGDREPFAYRFRITGHDDHVWELDDPYRFELPLTDFDIYLHGEGTHYRTYEKMGAHEVELDGVEGVHFAVWAPNALRVSVTGWFNRWDGRCHPMQRRGSSGVWELFLPALKPGDLYKFEVLGPGGYLVEKSDPYAFAGELRPRTASMVWDNHRYTWQDEDWMKARISYDGFSQPISIYEVHPGSWKRRPDEGNRWLTYREMADELLPYAMELGFTHIELLPISEHPFDGSWGYQTIGYFAPTSRFGTPDDLKYFIDRCHQEGIGVIIDWVPAHFPKDGHGLAYFDGTHLYEHSDPRQGEHMDWGTLIFNYGRNEVKSFLLSNAMYWADVFHIDGIRVDAVASMLYLDYSRENGEWIPNRYGGRENLEAVEFVKTFNQIIHEAYPGFITFAEESTAWPMVSRPTHLGGLGFDLKWNMGWMNDTLDYFEKESVHRKYHHGNLTFSLIYAFSENFILPFSHDEVVHGKRSMLSKMPGDTWQQFANLRLLYTYLYMHPGKKLLFMGAEFGPWKEWDCHESLDWHLLEHSSHQGLQRLVRDLNRIYTSHPALHQIDFSWEGFQWLDYKDAESSIVSFLRRGHEPGQVMICAFNATPVPRSGFRLGVPGPGLYREVFSSDDEVYGGSGIRRTDPLPAEAGEWQDMPFSIVIDLPPLGGVMYARCDADG